MVLSGVLAVKNKIVIYGNMVGPADCCVKRNKPDSVTSWFWVFSLICGLCSNTIIYTCVHVWLKLAGLLGKRKGPARESNGGGNDQHICCTLFYTMNIYFLKYP